MLNKPRYSLVHSRTAHENSSARSVMGIKRIRALATLSISAFLLSSGLPVAAETATVATETSKSQLASALSQIAQEYTDTSQKIADLIWLSSMAERIEKRVPDPFYRVRLLKTVLDESRAVGLSPQLVLAVMDVESGFRRDAISKSGALGLMQVMPFWKDVYSRPDDDLMNPLVSIRYGCNVLRHYMDRYDNVRNALAAYNGSLGFSRYPDLVIKRYKKRWQYELAPYDPLTLYANTQSITIPNDFLGALVLPESQALLANRPAPVIIEQSEPLNEGTQLVSATGVSGQ